MPLFINGLGDRHTHIHTHNDIPDKKQFQKDQAYAGCIYSQLSSGLRIIKKPPKLAFIYHTATEFQGYKISRISKNNFNQDEQVISNGISWS